MSGADPETNPESGQAVDWIVDVVEASEAKPVPTNDIVDVVVDTDPPLAPQFYGALGYAIATWQQVETNLCKVFESVSTCRDQQVAKAIFYAPQAFREKLKLTHFAARLCLSGRLLDEWTKLQARLDRLSQVRNALAHFHVAYQVPVGTKGNLVARRVTESGHYMTQTQLGGFVALQPDLSAKPVGALKIRPNTADPNDQFKKKPETKQPMGIRELVEVRVAFNQLAQDVKAFAAKMIQSNPPPKDDPQPSAS